MPGTLAALVASLAFDDLVLFVDALPRPVFAVLRNVIDERVWAERWRHLPTPAPVVVTPAADPEALVTAEEAARVLRVSLDTLYARVERGELVPLPRVRGGRLRFRRGDLVTRPAVANAAGPGYIPVHDSLRRATPPPSLAVDPTPSRGGPQRDGDDRRPMGARRAHSHAARRDCPWAPGKAAWAGPGDPDPKGGGA
jgi:excisionase family DNA binding protein